MRVTRRFFFGSDKTVPACARAPPLRSFPVPGDLNSRHISRKVRGCRSSILRDAVNSHDVILEIVGDNFSRAVVLLLDISYRPGIMRHISNPDAH